MGDGRTMRSVPEWIPSSTTTPPGPTALFDGFDRLKYARASEHTQTHTHTYRTEWRPVLTHTHIPRYYVLRAPNSIGQHQHRQHANAHTRQNTFSRARNYDNDYYHYYYNCSGKCAVFAIIPKMSSVSCRGIERTHTHTHRRTMCACVHARTHCGRLASPRRSLWVYCKHIT